MGAHGVVVDPLSFDDTACFMQRPEDMFVEATIAQAPVEGLDEDILHGLAGSDVMPLDVGYLDPAQGRVAREFGSRTASAQIIVAFANTPDGARY
jgi:hypothetical protein